MATRIYLPNTGASDINPTFGTWTETTGADRIKGVTSRISSVMTNKVQAHAATAANSTFLSRQYVIGPLAGQTYAATTIKGTIRVLESAANDNLDAMRLLVRVVAPDANTFRGTIYGPTNGTVGEFNTALRAKRLAVGGATTQVVITEGDYLVIDIGTTSTVGGTSLSDTISYGDDSATDLGDNETDLTALNPFVELAGNIKFLQRGFGQAQAKIKGFPTQPGLAVGRVRHTDPYVNIIGFETSTEWESETFVGYSLSTPNYSGTQGLQVINQSGLVWDVRSYAEYKDTTIQELNLYVTYKYLATSFPSIATTAYNAVFTNSSNIKQVGIKQNSDGKWALARYDAAEAETIIGTSTNALAPNTWYPVQFSVTNLNSNGSISISATINNETITGNSQTLQDVGLGILALGGSPEVSPNYTFSYDDVIIRNDRFANASEKLEKIAATAVGSHNQWTLVGTGALNEDNGTTNGYSSATLAQEQSATLSNTSFIGQSTGIKVIVQTGGMSGSQQKISIKVITNSNEYTYPVSQIQTGAKVFGVLLEKNPNTNALWTKTEIDALEIGVVQTSGVSVTLADIHTYVVYIPQAYGQAQAKIGGGLTAGFGQAQADIKAVGRGFGQSQADIKATSNGFGQAQADIEATSNGYGQTQADIKAIGRGFGQAQTDIKTTARGVAQALAVIDTGIYASSDTFTRTTVSPSLGTADVGGDWVSLVQGGGGNTISANGSVATLQQVGTPTSVSLDRVSSGKQHQVLVKFIPSATAGNFAFRVLTSKNAETTAFNGVVVSYVSATGIATVTMIAGTSTKVMVPVPSVALSIGTSTAYWVKVQYSDTGFGENAARAAIWADGSPEPALSSSELVTNSRIIGLGRPAFVISSGASSIQIDDWSSQNIAWYMAGQAQAKIKAFDVNSFGQAQADILAKSNSFGQAQASISAGAASQFGQAQADILATFNGFAQAQADILVTNFQVAQAQALILQTVQQFAQAQAAIMTVHNGFGQSQADIKATSNGFGQAQTDIKTTYAQFAQAQADIKQTYQAYGQSQADIKAISWGFAQAQTDIKAISNNFAQSQANIKQTYNQFGQAQADIKQTYQTYGQSQADIKAVGNGLGQANADILATSNGFGQTQAKINAFGVSGFGQANARLLGAIQQYGQSQAKIKAFGVTGCGQAQADIKATSRGYGQSQADIKVTSNVFAQAQARILATSNGYGQTQADIKAVGFGLGQSQADIKAVSRGYGQTQADIKAISKVFSQAQADIVATSSGFGQSQADIKATSYQSAQAQAKIRAFNVCGFGQAQSDIKATSRGYGQANSLISRLTSGFGQTQADILATSQVYGQAQSDIKTINYSSGQSQADIKKTDTVSGNAQALIRTVVNTYGQSQADIKQTYQSYAQAQASIITNGGQFAQAEGYIKTIVFGTGQAEAFISKSAGYAQVQAFIRQEHQLKNVTISDRHSITLSLSDRSLITTTNNDEKTITLVLSDRNY